MADSERVKCPGCDRLTRKNRNGGCMYCGYLLSEAAAQHSEPRQLGGKARFVPQADQRVHYLLTPVGEPVTLDAGKLFVLGRNQRASLVVKVPDVSSQHAEIDWEGEPAKPLLNEIRARNGTFINEMRVVGSEPLRSGDEIRLGTHFTMTYLYCTEREFQEFLREQSSDPTRGGSEKLFDNNDRDDDEHYDDDPPESEVRPTQAMPLSQYDALHGDDNYEDRHDSVARASSLSRAEDALLDDYDDEGTRRDNRESAPEPPRRAAVAIPVSGDTFVDSDELPEWAPRGRVHPTRVYRGCTEEAKTGIIVFFDGTAMGSLVFDTGKLRFAYADGDKTGKSVLQAFLRQPLVLYRFMETDPSPALTDGSPFDLNGFFKGEKLPDLLELLYKHQASGLLGIFDKTHAAVLTVKEGNVESVRCNGDDGDDAIERLESIEDGRFRMHLFSMSLTPIDPNAPIDEPTPEGGWNEPRSRPRPQRPPIARPAATTQGFRAHRVQPPGAQPPTTAYPRTGALRRPGRPNRRPAGGRPALRDVAPREERRDPLRPSKAETPEGRPAGGRRRPPPPPPKRGG